MTQFLVIAFLATRGVLLGATLFLGVALWILATERTGGLGLLELMALNATILVAPAASLAGFEITQRFCVGESGLKGALRTRVPEAAFLLVMLSLLEGNSFFALLERGFHFAQDTSLLTSGRFFLGLGVVIGEKALTFSVILSLAALAFELPCRIFLRASDTAIELPWTMMRMLVIGILLTLGARLLVEQLMHF